MEFEILTYSELKEKNSMLPLMEQAFVWPFNPARFEKSIRTDPRLKGGSVGFCAVKEGKVVGYVGVMDFALRTALGTEERVGGLYGVATLPGYTRRGISTALINHSHEYFVTKGYRFSFLTTSPTLVAYSLFRKLGYFDVAPFLSAYLEAKIKRQEAFKHGSLAKLDYGRMLDLFRQYVKGRTGFVIRNIGYLRMLFKQSKISAKDCVMTEKGYIIFKKEEEAVKIRELVAQSSEEMNRLIGLVESKTRKPLVGRLGIPNSTVIQAYESRGFTVLETPHLRFQDYGVLMAKELVTDASFNDYFGNAFHMSALDHF